MWEIGSNLVVQRRIRVIQFANRKMLLVPAYLSLAYSDMIHFNPDYTENSISRIHICLFYEKIMP